MYKIGLTGGIGSGKSKVADLLAGWGAAIVDTDVIAHDLTAPGGTAIEPIRQQFGPDVIAPTGALDRQAMRELVFESPEARHKLESIIHPMISSVTRQRASEAQGCYLVFVVPLLIESLQHSSRWRDQADRICVVDCDPATQVARVQSCGPCVIAPTGARDRQSISELLLQSPEARHKHESIIHPMISSVTRQRASEAQGGYLVFVVPLLIESLQHSSRWRDQADRICVVD